MAANGFNYDLIIPIIAIGGGLVIAALAIIFGVVKSIARDKEFEQTRREIAAYVAEGSMTPDDAERLLAARKEPCEE